MSEGNTCIAEPSLEVLLKTSLVFFKSLNNNVRSHNQTYQDAEVFKGEIFTFGNFLKMPPTG